MANFIAKSEQSNIPADLLETNKLLSIYPIRRQAAASTTAATTAVTAPTAASMETDAQAEEFSDNVERRHQNTFPRWQNFPFSAESIQVRLKKQAELLSKQLSRGEICVANFIPPGNGAIQGNYFLPKSQKLAVFEEMQAYKNSSGNQSCKLFFQLVVGSG